MHTYRHTGTKHSLHAWLESGQRSLLHRILSETPCGASTGTQLSAIIQARQLSQEPEIAFEKKAFFAAVQFPMHVLGALSIHSSTDATKKENTNKQDHFSQAIKPHMYLVAIMTKV